MNKNKVETLDVKYVKGDDNHYDMIIWNFNDDEELIQLPQLTDIITFAVSIQSKYDISTDEIIETFNEVLEDVNNAWRGGYNNQVKYGDVFWIDLDDLRTGLYHHKQKGIRPCVIVGNNENNNYCELLQIIPLSTKKDHLPQHKGIVIKGVINYLLPEQIMTIHRSLIRDKMCHLNEKSLLKVREAMKIQFNL